MLYVAMLPIIDQERNTEVRPAHLARTSTNCSRKEKW